MMRYKWLILGGVVVVLAGATIAAEKRLRPAWKVYNQPMATMELEVRSDAPGLLAFSASAHATIGHKPVALLWWHAEARPYNADGQLLPAIWERDFDEPNLLTQARRGVEVKPRLPEQRLELPSGFYNVYIELREDSGRTDGRGNLIQSFSEMAGNSKNLAVE
jgi:hypothetical protein